MVGKPALATAMKSGRRGAAMFVRRSGSLELVPLMRTHLLDKSCERPLLRVLPRARRRRPSVGFETENLLQLDDKAVIPVLLYLFRRIEQRLDGSPTLVLLDEVWSHLQHELF